MNNFPLSALTLVTAAVGLASIGSAQRAVADLTPYGSKCGEIQVEPTLPLIGQNLRVTVRSRDARNGLLLIGTDRVAVAIGACTVHLAPAVALPWSGSTAGTATVLLPIAADPALLGAQFRFQASANNQTAPLSLSRGYLATVGNCIGVAGRWTTRNPCIPAHWCTIDVSAGGTWALVDGPRNSNGTISRASCPGAGGTWTFNCTTRLLDFDISPGWLVSSFGTTATRGTGCGQTQVLVKR